LIDFRTLKRFVLKLNTIKKAESR